ncbi:hypothetical protein ACVWZ6_002619 [Bradyrhizobium sp. GM6.1]
MACRSGRLFALADRMTCGGANMSADKSSVGTRYVYVH